MASRGQRVLHGAAAALISTFVAAFSHGIAGGGAPGAIALALALAFSTVACTLMSSRAISSWRLAVSVALSQAVFHTLFSLFGPIAGTASGNHAASGMPTAVLSTLDHHGTTAEIGGTVSRLTTATITGHTLGGPDTGMVAGHLVAAVITFLVIQRGERSLSTVILATRLAATRLFTLRPPEPLIEPLAIQSGPIHRIALRPALVLLAPANRRRGPPISTGFRAA